LAHLRNFGFGEELDGGGFIGGGDGFGGVPVEVREVGVGGILGVGRITKQPVVVNDAIEVGTVLPLSLSVDHRIADGGETARFLNRIMDYLAEPVRMMFD
jgi:pyruvate/2-oxoglutarate dehydrogenase complex dihydrolipoamide acyltransferase (E2) component